MGCGLLSGGDAALGQYWQRLLQKEGLRGLGILITEEISPVSRRNRRGEGIRSDIITLRTGGGGGKGVAGEL